MLSNNEEYISYLKSFTNDKKLNEAIYNYRNNIISFDDLEHIAIDNLYLSKYNYFKIFKIGKILSNNK